MDEPRRRATDHVDPAVELLMEQKLHDARHAIRSDVAVIGSKVEMLGMQVEKAAAASSLEHAQNAARLDAICARLEVLETLPSRLSVLEEGAQKEQARDQAREEIRRTVWKAAAALAAIVAAVNGVIALLG